MDFEFWLRLGKNHSFKHANRILAGNRIHKGRKTISGAQKSKLETRLVMQNYGARFDSKYHLLRYLIDPPYFQINKVLGAITIGRSIFLGSGMSLTLVPIVGLLLNYTPLGIRLTPIVLSLLTLTTIFATVAVIREHETAIPESRNKNA
jgi:hypothetical protein